MVICIKCVTSNCYILCLVINFYDVYHVPIVYEFNDTCSLFSLKNKRGTRFTPMFQWPDKSVSLGVTQPLAWKRSGLMVRPSIQVR